MDDGTEKIENGFIGFKHTDGEPYILTWKEEGGNLVKMEFSSKEALLAFKTEFLSILEEQGL
jgi:hypothetical protein